MPHKLVLNLSDFKGRMGHTVMNSCFLQHPFSLSNAICFDITVGYQHSSAFFCGVCELLMGKPWSKSIVLALSSQPSSFPWCNANPIPLIRFLVLSSSSPASHVPKKVPFLFYFGSPSSLQGASLSTLQEGTLWWMQRGRLAVRSCGGQDMPGHFSNCC